MLNFKMYFMEILKFPWYVSNVFIYIDVIYLFFIFLVNVESDLQKNNAPSKLKEIFYFNCSFFVYKNIYLFKT